MKVSPPHCWETSPRHKQVQDTRFFFSWCVFFKDVAENVTLSAPKNPSNPIVTALLGKF